MPDVEISSTGPGRVTSKWYSSILTPQTVVMICAGFVAVVIFWKTSKDNWDKVKQQESMIEKKAEDSDLKTLAERVNRQYETNNKILDRIIEVEKKLSYEAGVSEGERQERRRQRDARLGN